MPILFAAVLLIVALVVAIKHYRRVSKVATVEDELEDVRVDTVVADKQKELSTAKKALDKKQSKL